MTRPDVDSTPAWNETDLDSLCIEITVGHVGSMATQYEDRGIPFLRSQNVEYLRLNLTDVRYIGPEFHRRLRKSRLQPGDVVIVRTGAPGTCAVIPDSLREANCSDLVIVRCGPHLDPNFLAYYINSSAKHYVNAHLVGAVQQHFNVGSARTIRLRLPSIQEQRAIVAVLGALDDKIELNRKMSATLEAIARALFKSWFVDFEPVRAKAEGRDPGLPAEIAALFPQDYQDSEFEKIPSGWKAVNLGDVSSRIAMGPFGSRITRSNFVKDGVPVVRGGNLRNGFIDDDFVYLTPEKALELKSARATSGDLVFTHRGTLGQVGLVPRKSKYPEYIVSQSQMILEVNRNLATSEYLYLWFTSGAGQAALLANTTQTGVPALARPVTNLRAIRILLPPKEVLEAFDALMTPLLMKCEAIVSENNCLASLRDALLPKLISGELRVADAERVLATSA